MDEAGFWHKVATGATGLAVALLTFLWKDHSDKVRGHELKLNSFPLLFISKEEFDKIHDRHRDASFALSEKVAEGFNRVFAKMDALQSEMADRNEKLRDLIDTRTLK